MCCGNDRLAIADCRADDIFLGGRHIGQWQFHAHVTPCHHDAVSGRYDLFQIFHAGLVLNLGNNGNVDIFLDENFPHFIDVIGGLNEGGGDVVDVVFGSKAQLSDHILAVLGADGAECQSCFGQVHALAVTQPATMDDTADDRGISDSRDDKFDGAIIKQDRRTGTDFLE